MTKYQNDNDLQYTCWYFTPGLHTIFASKKGTVSVANGTLTVTNSKTGEKVYTYKLYPDIQFRNFSGEVQIKFMNGQSNKVLDYRYLFYFYNPSLVFLRFLLTKHTKIANEFVEKVKQAVST